MENSNTNPLAIYNDLIINNGVNKLYNKFISNVEYGGFHFSNDNKSEIAIMDISETGEPYLYVEKFDDKMNIAFSRAYSHFTKYIDDVISKELLRDSKDLINRYQTQLKFLYNNCSNLTNENIAKNWLSKALKYLATRYGIENIPLDETFRGDDSEFDGLLGFKGNISAINNLYQKLCSLGFISSENTSISTFTNMVIATNEDELKNNSITLDCTLQKGAFIIEQIKCYFKNLTIGIIDEYGFLLTKQGKKITSNSFLVQKSKYSNDYSKEDERNWIIQTLS